MITTYMGKPGQGMSYTFTAPRGFIDPTRPERVQRVYSCPQAFNAYIAALRAGGLPVQFSSPLTAAYIREVQA